MNIVKFPVTSANYDVGRGGHAISGIVLHTMVGSWQGAQSRFNDPSSQVSVHYGVDLGGTIHQWVDEANTAWQAGNYPINQTTIGIEHEDDGNYNDAVRTPALYEASSDLVADICRRYNIPCDAAHIRRHHDVIDTSRYPGGTSCPDGLDTNKIIAMASAKLGGEIMTQDEVKLIINAVTHQQAKQVDLDAWTTLPWTQYVDEALGGQPWLTQNEIILDAYPKLVAQVAQLQKELGQNTSSNATQILADMQAVINKYELKS